MINSHIQVPKSLLKNFKNEYDQIDYLDIVTGRIEHKAASSLGTYQDYYSKTMEKWLNKNFEQPMSLLVNKVRLATESEQQLLELNTADVTSFKNFIKNAVARSNSYNKKCLESSSYGQFLPKQVLNDAFVSSASGANIMDNILSKGILNLVLDNTGVGFVLPRNCFYIIDKIDDSFIFCPVTPKISLALRFNHDELLRNSQVSETLGIREIKEINYLNNMALQYEYKSNYISDNKKFDYENSSFVVANNRIELKRLQQELKAYKTN